MKVRHRYTQTFTFRVTMALYLPLKDFILRVPRVPFGCITYVGEVGSGKTLSAIERLEAIRQGRIYNVPIHIMTNIGYKHQHGSINSVQDILDAPDNTVFLIDEASTLFNSRKWQNFPIEMFAQLVQNRKNRKAFLLTQQEFDHTDKNFRQLTNWVVECDGFFDRVFKQNWFKPRDYKRVVDSVDNEFIAKKIRKRRFFVGDDKLRSVYDTLEVVKQLQKANEENTDIELTGRRLILR